jgi:dolichol-phosphate mannosyltransferase
VINWPIHRKVLSRGGNIYTRVLLGMPISDATGGYRAYRSSALHKMDLHDVASAGYCFQVDLAWRAVRLGLRVVEVPITFVERTIGDSKMSHGIVGESLRNVTMWGAKYRRDQVRSLVRREPRWHRLDR